MNTRSTIRTPAMPSSAPSTSTGAPQSAQNQPPIGQNNAPSPPPRTYTARIPIPVMHGTNFDAWIQQMEYWFLASGITDEMTQCASILSHIDQNVFTQINDEVIATPIPGKYQFVRQKLSTHYADSEQRNLNRLLSEMPLGDKKPSELYFEMKNVAGNVLGDIALKSLWAQRLPEAARPVIAASGGPATEFTKVADKIVDALNAGNVNSITATPIDDLTELHKQIFELRQQLKNLPSRSRSHSRGSYKQRRSSSSANKTNGNNDDCWFHQKYGINARKCRSPCRHSKRSHTPTAASNNNQQNA